MSKRCFPWADGTPQRKTCVKDGAVAGEAERQAVYEHTQALLFSGARSLQLSPTPTVSPFPSPRRGTARGGQIQIGSRGELLRSPGNTADTLPSPACTLCERPLLTSARCVRCEKVVCIQCLRSCSLCLRTHCFICCQPNYSEHYERMVCIDCLPK